MDFATFCIIEKILRFCGTQEMVKGPATDNFRRPGEIYLQVNTLLVRKGFREVARFFFSNSDIIFSPLLYPPLLPLIK